MVFEYGMEYIGQPVRMIAYTNAKETTLMLAKVLRHHVAGIVVNNLSQNWVIYVFRIWYYNTYIYNV